MGMAGSFNSVVMEMAQVFQEAGPGWAPTVDHRETSEVQSASTKGKGSRSQRIYFFSEAAESARPGLYNTWFCDELDGYFAVPKGSDDIHMVYDASKSHLNA